jgi:hypothetical protein
MAGATILALEPPMTPDWNAIRLDLLAIDEAMRSTLREMRPFFAKSMPGILARFYDRVRHYEPSSAIFKDGAMQEVIRMQVEHWDLIAAGDFGAAYNQLRKRAIDSAPSSLRCRRHQANWKPPRAR